MSRPAFELPDPLPQRADFDEFFAHVAADRAEAIEQACASAMVHNCGLRVYDWNATVDGTIVVYTECHPDADMAPHTIEYLPGPPP
jgi:hypothetical protein